MVTDVQSWLDAGAELVAKLTAERQQLVARIAQIDAALAQVGKGHEALEPPVARQVFAALAAAGRPMTAREVRAALPRAERLTILGALHRLAKRGEIRARDENGRRLYATRKEP